MTHFIAFVHKEKNSAFGVQFPDVPGCFSAADRMLDLVGNASEALALWAEDEVLPRPRSIDKIVVNKSVAAELAAGAFLVSVPFVVSDTKVVSAAMPRRSRISCASAESSFPKTPLPPRSKKLLGTFSHKGRRLSSVQPSPLVGEGGAKRRERGATSLLASSHKALSNRGAP